MEPLGLVVAIAGLAGAFTACVDCFEHVQFGRQFGQDYAKCLLRLDLTKLRMSRWGAAMGLGPNMTLESQIVATAGERTTVRRLLHQIVKSFKKAEEVSKKYSKSPLLQKTKAEDKMVYNADSDLGSRFRRLHLTLRNFAGRQQHDPGLGKITIWALYEKEQFETLIAEVTEFVDTLVGLFPTIQGDQETLCKSEVSAIGETQDLEFLTILARGDDKMLASQLEQEMERRGHSFTNWSAGGDSKMWAGDENEHGVRSESHNYSKFAISERADVHLGNLNRGPRKPDTGSDD